MDATTPPPPELRSPQLQGLLSRTLSSSPATKWILPARLRSPSKNDLVFVGESSIHLREFISTDEPCLAEPSCSINFDSQILAADVISANINIVAISTDEQILQQKQTVEEESYSSDGRPIRDGEPAQVLVLSTSNAELIFIYATEDFDGTVRFVHATKPLLTGPGVQDQRLLHLAHDHESRALAVAPNRGLCMIGSLPSLDTMKNEIDQWRPAGTALNIFRKQRLLQVDGEIVQMDFIHPLREDKSKLMLVLIVAKQDRTYMVLYRWDAQQPLHRIRPMRSSGQAMPDSDAKPLMLIPCNAPASFFLVTRSGLVLYDWITHSEARRTAHPLSDQNEFPDGNRTKMWTQWARPRRHETHRRTADEIMLVREDGLLHLYDIDVQPALRVKLAWPSGKLDIKMQQAMCLLPAPLHIGGGDILVACGENADGGVYHLRARKPNRCVQRIANVTSTNDLLLFPPTSSRDTNVDRRSRIFACAGDQQGNGGLVEVCHGIEANVRMVIQDDELRSILRIWTIPKNSDEVLILSAHPLYSSLISLDMSKMEPFEETADTLPGIDLEATTLAAAAMSDDVLAQVSTSGLRIVSTSGRHSPFRDEMSTTSLICASIEPLSGALLAAHQEGDEYMISTYKVVTSPQPRLESLASPYSVRHQPTCVCISRLGEEVIALAVQGDGGRHLTGMRISSAGTVHFTADLLALSPELAPLSIGTSVGLLVCGSRNGFLLCLEVRISQQLEETRLKPVLSRRLARTSVNVSTDEFSRRSGCADAAFVAYGSILERLSLQANDAGADIDRTYITVQSRDRSDHSSVSPEVLNAVGRVPSVSSDQSESTAGLLVCATSNSLTTSTLSRAQKAIFRHVQVPGVAKKVVYSRFLKSMVIGVNPGPDSKDNTMVARPMICYAALQDEEADCGPIDKSKVVVLGTADDPEEKISALTHYSPANERHHFEMTLVALQSRVRIDKSDKFRINSRIVCISDKHVKKADPSRGPIKVSNVMNVSKKRVTALCPIGRSGLLIGSNNELLLHNLDVESKKWSTITRHSLPSPARQIRVLGSMIYVATEKHSLLILKEHSNTLGIQNSDMRARAIADVLPLHRQHVFIADTSPYGTRLTGVVEDQQGATLQRTFELHLPQRINRLELDSPIAAQLTQSSRPAIVGTSSSGHMYRFTSLSAPEWMLCHFLIGLTKPGMRIGAKTIGQELDFSPRMEKTQRLALPPQMMGIDGDLLARILEDGHRGKFGLRSVLGLDETSIKVEKDGTYSNGRTKADDADEDVVMSSSEAAMDMTAPITAARQSSEPDKEVKEKLQTLQKLLSKVTDRVQPRDIVGSTMIWLRELLQS
ncbi:uncharacterized protein AB675_3051 [Cyphellophora attinorum]|uniref:RSE1/DDB1/CPSF1 first beta-propeller domain-containing protein n=1 Tax=Cyphellophora attinorum TaxID=1664694 RepID=A0A0N0NKB8_9EURO|nr:uncharacterized protein AB675_3051 [Phialophora attinorum]KPI37961.1 hypothetical protein AB675_3051 [Phialophora attinorum]